MLVKLSPLYSTPGLFVQLHPLLCQEAHEPIQGTDVASQHTLKNVAWFAAPLVSLGTQDLSIAQLEL